MFLNSFTFSSLFSSYISTGRHGADHYSASVKGMEKLRGSEWARTVPGKEPTSHPHEWLLFPEWNCCFHSLAFSCLCPLLMSLPESFLLFTNFTTVKIYLNCSLLEAFSGHFICNRFLSFLSLVICTTFMDFIMFHVISFVVFMSTILI